MTRRRSEDLFKVNMKLISSLRLSCCFFLINGNVAGAEYLESMLSNATLSCVPEGATIRHTM